MTNVGRVKSPEQAEIVELVGDAPMEKGRVGGREGVESVCEGVQRARNPRLSDVYRALIGSDRRDIQ